MVRRPSSPAIWLLVLALMVTAAALWVPAMHSGGLRGAHAVPWLVLLVAFVMTDLLVAKIDFGGQIVSLDFSSVPLLVGLCFVSPGRLLLARLVALAVVLILRSRRPLLKLIFNLANTWLVVGAAIVVYGATRGLAGAAEPRAWLAAFVASLTVFVICTTTMTTAISLSLRRFALSTSTLAVTAGMTLANVAVGLIAINVILVDWRGLWLILGVGVTMWAGYQQFVRFRQRHLNLRLLYRFTKSVSEATDTDVVIARSLELAREMLRVEVAFLVLETREGIVRHSLRDGMVVSEHVLAEDVPVAAAVLAGRRAILLADGDRDDLRTNLDAHGWRDLLASAVDGEVRGALVVANRDSDVGTFDEEDAKFLEALAGQTAIALRASDLFDQLRAEAADKAHQATHDALTGLGNRTLLIKKLEEELVTAEPTNLLAVYFIDLDGFKEVNDALGHHTGDLLLIEVANRMNHQLSRRATIARLGGDEFALVVAGLGSGQEARTVGCTIRDLVQQPVEIDGMKLEVRASVGVSIAPVHGDDASILFQRADIAMYSAKERRSGVELYDEDLDHSSARRLSLVGDLRHAIEEGDLRLHYQPQADARTGRILGVEALTRWVHPVFGFVPPDEFIPIAEQTGLIQPLTKWALRTALTDLSSWRRMHPELRMSVNLSARSLMDAGLVSDVAQELADQGIPADALTLELTESSVMADPERSLVQLGRLREMGVRLAIDDFGTGYSSLSYLKRLPVTEVKIDKSFVLAMSKDSDDAVIVRSTIDLADNLGLEVVAEGVEDAVTWDLLADLGCEVIQGYHLSRPMPATDILAFLGQVPLRQDTQPEVLEFRRPPLSHRPLSVVGVG